MEIDAEPSAELWDWAVETDDWVPPQVDTTVPSSARMYDYALGGKDSFPVDRAAADEIMKVAPQGRELALANRSFLVHVVEAMTRAGITQFLDLGTGIPRSPNVHEVAQEINPAARVAYVDNDPIVMVHSRALLAGHPGVAAVQHDLREPAAVLDDPAVARVIDFARPVGLLMVAVLHFVDPRIAPMVVHQYVRRLPPGSLLAASLASTEGVDPVQAAQVESVYRRSPTPLYLRSRAQIEELFDGLELLPPGLVDVDRWGAPGGHATAAGMLAGLARKGS